MKPLKSNDYENMIIIYDVNKTNYKVVYTV